MEVKFRQVFGIEVECNAAGQQRRQQLGLFGGTFPIIADLTRNEHKYERGGNNPGKERKDEQQSAAEAGLETSEADHRTHSVLLPPSNSGFRPSRRSTDGLLLTVVLRGYSGTIP